MDPSGKRVSNVIEPTSKRIKMSKLWQTLEESSSEESEQEAIAKPSESLTPPRPIMPRLAQSLLEGSSESEDIPVAKPFAVVPTEPMLSRVIVPSVPMISPAWTIVDVCNHFTLHPLNQQTITNLRQKVGEEWTQMRQKPANFESLNPQDTQLLFELIDRHFLLGKLSEWLKANNSRLTVTPNTKLTSTGGRCIMQRDPITHSYKKTNCVFRIDLAPRILLETFKKGEVCHSSGGVKCCSRLECLQLILEHELVHLLVDLFCPELSTKTGKTIHHGAAFKRLILNLFGQTEVKHRLLLGDASAMEAQAAQAKALRVGDKIQVRNKDGTLAILTVTKKPGKARVSARGILNGRDSIWKIPLSLVIKKG